MGLSRPSARTAPALAAWLARSDDAEVGAEVVRQQLGKFDVSQAKTERKSRGGRRAMSCTARRSLSYTARRDASSGWSSASSAMS